MAISSDSLGGETALVTGAGRGIGRGIALGLAQAGARVALLARSGDELDQTASQAQELGIAAGPAGIAELHRRFTTSYYDGKLTSPQQSAQSLLARLDSDDNGRIWSFSDPA